MTRKMLITSAAIVAMSTTAMAADLPSHRAPPVFVPPPVFSWAGFYVGGQIGYAFGRDNAVFDESSLPRPPAQPFFPYGSSLSGVIGGGHVGYNVVLPGNIGFGTALVAGIEGSVDGTDYSRVEDLGGAINAALAGRRPDLIGALPNTVRSRIQGSVRGRLGVAFDRALFYATGGAGFADFQSSYDKAGGLANLPIPGLPTSFSHGRVGYTVGGGVEYAILPNWSLRAEYRYTDFGTFADPITFLSNGTGIVTPVHHHETENQVQLGFSYRFDTPLAPVVARY